MFSRQMFSAGFVQGGNYSDTRTDANSVSITFSNGGTVINSNNDTIGNWFVPPQSGIGSSYWIKFEQTSSNATYTGSTLSTWHQISGNPLVRINAAPAGQVRTWNGTYIISDSAGGPTLGSGNLTLESDRT